MIDNNANEWTRLANLLGDLILKYADKIDFNALEPPLSDDETSGENGAGKSRDAEKEEKH